MRGKEEKERERRMFKGNGQCKGHEREAYTKQKKTKKTRNYTIPYPPHHSLP